MLHAYGGCDVLQVHVPDCCSGKAVIVEELALCVHTFPVQCCMSMCTADTSWCVAMVARYGGCSPQGPGSSKISCNELHRHHCQIAFLLSLSVYSRHNLRRQAERETHTNGAGSASFSATQPRGIPASISLFTIPRRCRRCDLRATAV